MKASGFENVISIEKFEYYATVDAHEHCDFSCYVKEENIDYLVSLVDREVLFDNDDFKFSGHITAVSYSKDISGCFVEVKSIGNTYIFNQDKKKRVFQNEEKTLSDILSFMESMSDVKIEGDYDPVLKDMIYQNNETDWEFMCRVCKSIGAHIFTGKNVFIGKYSSGNSKEITEKECIDYEYTSSIEGAFLNCQLKNNLYLGDRIDIFGKHFGVIEKRYKLVNQQYIYMYVLKEIADEIIVCEKNDSYIEAVVIDNDDPDRKGRLQVTFETDDIQDCMKDSPIWIERLDLYASKGLGTIFIPNIEDKVRIHLYDGKPYVIGCIREEEYSEHYQDSNNKYLLLSDNIYFEYKEGKISLFNKDNKIEVSEDIISISVGDQSTIVSEKEKICITVDKSIAEISSNIKVKADKVVTEAKTETSVTAAKVNIKGKSGVSIN